MKKKTFYGLIGFVIILVIAYVITSFAFGGVWNPFKWGKGSKIKQEHEVDGISGVFIGEGEEHGVSLCSARLAVQEYEDYGIDPLSTKDSYRLIASYSPANATFQETEYTAKFKNSSSAWATGKNVSDYVTLQHEPNSKEAVITILQGFSEQIIVTARNVKYSNLYAVTTVDWLADTYNFDFLYTSVDDTTVDLEFGNGSWYGGSIKPTGSRVEVIFDIGSFATQMHANGFTQISSTQSIYFYIDEVQRGDAIVTIDNIFRLACRETYENDFNNCWNAACKILARYGSGCIITYSYNVHRYYNGQLLDVTFFDEQQDIEVDNVDIYEIQATGVTTNNSSIVGWEVKE